VAHENDEIVPKKITGEYTKGHVLSNGKVIPHRITKIVTEPPMDDFIIRQLSKYDELVTISESDDDYDADWEGDFLPVNFLKICKSVVIFRKTNL
jgi:hypothetical protein